MNATVQNAANYWQWIVEYYTNYDGDAGDVYRIHNNNPSLWSLQADYDIPLQLRLKPVKKISNEWRVKEYSSPTDIKIWYNSTARYYTGSNPILQLVSI